MDPPDQPGCPSRTYGPLLGLGSLVVFEICQSPLSLFMEVLAYGTLHSGHEKNTHSISRMPSAATRGVSPQKLDPANLATRSPDTNIPRHRVHCRAQSSPTIFSTNVSSSQQGQRRTGESSKTVTSGCATLSPSYPS